MSNTKFIKIGIKTRILELSSIVTPNIPYFEIRMIVDLLDMIDDDFTSFIL